MPKNFGYSDARWNAAKSEARAAMIEAARSPKQVMTYTELASKVNAIQVDAHDIRLNHLLCDVSTDENAAGRGMLSVVVVHKHGDQRPGAGFFELAEELGHDVSDWDTFWLAERSKVISHWTKQGK